MFNKGITRAYGSFDYHLEQVKGILKLGNIGIKVDDDKRRQFIKKHFDIKGTPGPKPKSYIDDWERTENADGSVTITMDNRIAYEMKTMLEDAGKFNSDLKYILNSVLAVSIWGSFETYNQLLFEELFRSNPNMMKCKETISLENIIDNKDSILEFVIEKQIEKIGHFNIAELIKYLSDKLDYSLNNANTEKLSKYYFVRNILTHKSGIIRPLQKDKISSNVRIKDGRILISKTYLMNMVKDIDRIVLDIEKHIKNKFPRYSHHSL